MSATCIVAAANSSDEAKRRADLVCDGERDEIALAASLARADQYDVAVDIDPAARRTVRCIGRHAVRWLPGDYRLGGTLVIPPAADLVIDAEGAHFSYSGESGDAIVIGGCLRCRYRFGAIASHSANAAIRVRPTPEMPALMSIVSFTGLLGAGRGIGLCLDPTDENVCTNRFEGTDISGFATGVLVMTPGPARPPVRPTAKADTNHYWFSYIRRCATCIHEGGNGVDCGFWTVNVDASIPGAVGIRTAAAYGRWQVIMGTWERRDTRALILDPGATHNVFAVQPPIEEFAWEDRSGTGTNIVGR